MSVERPQDQDRQPDPEGLLTRQDFAAALTVLREQRGLTVRQVARAAGLQSSTVGGYFSGRHLPPLNPANVLPDVLRACGVTDAVVRERWRRALLRLRRTPGPRPAGAPVPYRGLRTYQPEDAGWYCGREDLTRQLTKVLARRYAEGNGLLIAVGPSGSGKSSLLRAGLIPAVRAGELQVPGSCEWPLALITPGPDPIERLQDEVITAACESGGLLLVVDQAEQMFTGVVTEEYRAAFIAQLDRLARGVDRPCPALVVMALRADFYGSALVYPELAAGLQDAQVVVGPMTARQLRSVIVEPARRADVHLEESLVEVLIRDLVPAGSGTGSWYRTGALPLLSHALLVTWERGQGRRLTLADYRGSGGLRSAVARTAEEAYGCLTDLEKDLTRRLFLQLVRISAEGAVTARQAGRHELAAAANSAESHALAEVLERFIASRLLTAHADIVHISHEALLDAWPRLRGWVDADRDSLVSCQRLIDAAQAWDRERRDPAALFRGNRLAAAKDWAASGGRHALPPLVHEFLDASWRRERRNLRRLYQTITALAALLVVAVVAGVVAVQQRGQAVAQEQYARAERDRALSRLVADRADRIRDEDVSLAAQLSLASYQISPTVEARAALLDSSASHTATRLLGSTGVMQSVAFSPRRRLLAAGTADRTVLLWDLSNPDHPTRLASLTASSGIVYAVAFSPDGRTLAAGSGDHLIHLWDVTDRHRPVPLGEPVTGPTALVYAVAFSPDGRTLAAGSGDHLVHLWDLTGPSGPVRLPPLPGFGSYVQSVAFAPGGDLLAAGSDDTTVRLWDVSEPRRPSLLGEPAARAKDTVFAVTFGPDGRTLAAGSRDGNVYLWDITDPTRPVPRGAPLAGATGWVQTVAFSPDGETLAAGSSGQVWLWDWRSARVTTVLPHTGPVTSMAYGADPHTLITAAADGVARRWQLPGPQLRGDDVPINNVRFSPDGRLLAVASGETRLWSVVERIPHSPPITNRTEFSGAVAFAGHGDTLMISDRAGHIHTWDITNPSRPVSRGQPVNAHTLLVEQMALSPDGTILATGADDNLVRLWDVAEPGAPAMLAELEGFGAYVYSVQFDPDGDLLAAASVDNTVRIWDVRNPSRPAPVAGPLTSSEHYALSVAFHPHRPVLAVGSADKNVYLWDISDLPRATRLEPPLVGAGNYVYALAYSPDGSVLAAASTDGTLWLWDVTEPGRPSVRATLTAASGTLYTVAFHPDRPVLAAGGSGSTIWLWNTEPASVADHICRTAGDPITRAEWHKYVPDLPYQPPC